MRRVLATMLLVLAPAVALAQAPDQQAQFKQLAQTTIDPQGDALCDPRRQDPAPEDLVAIVGALGIHDDHVRRVVPK
jgi:hypothetical protein